MGEISVLHQNRGVYSNSIQGTLLSIHQICYFMAVYNIVKLLPPQYRGQFDALLHQPSVLCNSTIGLPRHLGIKVLTKLQTGMK